VSERRRHKVSERDGEILSYLIALQYEIKIQVMPFCCSTTITLFYFFVRSLALTKNIKRFFHNHLCALSLAGFREQPLKLKFI
jgi:hypothetical protein